MTLNELIAEWQKKVIYAKKKVTDGKGGVEDGGEVVVVRWDDKTVTLPAYAKEYLDMFISDCMTAVAEEAEQILCEEVDDAVKRDEYGGTGKETAKIIQDRFRQFKGEQQ